MRRKLRAIHGRALYKAAALGCDVLTPTARARPSHLQASSGPSSGGHRARAGEAALAIFVLAIVRWDLAFRLAVSFHLLGYFRTTLIAS